MPRTVLALPDGGLFLGELARRPAVNAVPGQVQLAPREPGRPLGTPGGVDHVLPRLGELDPQILDHRGPEPLRLLDRDAVELVVALDPQSARESRQVRALHVFGARFPDEVGHARSVRVTERRGSEEFSNL